jgi:hypothetical protein
MIGKYQCAGTIAGDGDIDLHARRCGRMTGVRSEMGGSVVERVIQCHVAAGRGVAVLIANVLQEVIDQCGGRDGAVAGEGNRKRVIGDGGSGEGLPIDLQNVAGTYGNAAGASI